MEYIPDDVFYCDVCEEIFSRKAKKRLFTNYGINPEHTLKLLKDKKYPHCILCGYVGGAMKKTQKGEWIHILCSLFIPGVYIHDFLYMKNIEVKQDLINFINNTDPKKCQSYKGESLFQLLYQTLSPKDQSTLKHIHTTEIYHTFCSICHSSEGVCYKCSDKKCDKYFHILCAWYNGLYFNIKKSELSPNIMYAGGGKCHSYNIYCIDHTPNCNEPAKRRNEQKNVRSICTNHPQKFYDSINKYISKLTRQKQKSSTVPITPSPFHRTIRVRDNGDTVDVSKNHQKPPSPPPFVPIVGDIYPEDICACCLYRNGNLIKCKKCGINVHADCYGIPFKYIVKRKNDNNEEKEKYVTTDYNNWLCDMCKNNVEDAICALCPRLGGAMRCVKDDIYIHVFCCHTNKRIKLLSDDENGGFIIDISSLQKKWLGVSKCDICEMQYGRAIPCSERNCLEKYHPLCAYFSQIPIINIIDYRKAFTVNIYCKNHIPNDAVFSKVQNRYIIISTKEQYLSISEKWKSIKGGSGFLENEDNELDNYTSQYKEINLKQNNIDNLLQKYKEIIDKARIEYDNIRKENRIKINPEGIPDYILNGEETPADIHTQTRELLFKIGSPELKADIIKKERSIKAKLYREEKKKKLQKDKEIREKKRLEQAEKRKEEKKRRQSEPILPKRKKQKIISSESDESESEDNEEDEEDYSQKNVNRRKSASNIPKRSNNKRKINTESKSSKKPKTNKYQSDEIGIINKVYIIIL